jgi:hypothetical protein
MSALYTALAILGWLTFCALIAWFVGSFVDFAAQLFDDEDGEVADAADFGDVAFIHQEMRRARNLEGGRSEQAGRADHRTHTQPFTTRLLSSGEEGLNRWPR